MGWYNNYILSKVWVFGLIELILKINLRKASYYFVHVLILNLNKILYHPAK